MVRATVEMAHALGLTIIAEGVETESVLNRVRMLGCDAVQGFLMHRPAAAERVTAALRSGLPPVRKAAGSRPRASPTDTTRAVLADGGTDPEP